MSKSSEHMLLARSYRRWVMPASSGRVPVRSCSGSWSYRSCSGRVICCWRRFMLTLANACVGAAWTVQSRSRMVKTNSRCKRKEEQQMTLAPDKQTFRYTRYRWEEVFSQLVSREDRTGVKVEHAAPDQGRRITLTIDILD